MVSGLTRTVTDIRNIAEEVGAASGALLEFGVIRRLGGAPRLVVLVATLAASMTISANVAATRRAKLPSVMRSFPGEKTDEVAAILRHHLFASGRRRPQPPHLLVLVL